jgi:hypothetical protein
MTTQSLGLEAAFLHAVGKKTKKARKNQFTREEIDVLDKYKKEYRKMTTTDARHALIRTHILVDIFNYWFGKGVISEEVDEKDMSQRISVRWTLLSIKLHEIINL